MLNFGLAKEYGIKTDPFRTLAFLDSENSDLMQLCDIIAGGFSEHYNCKAERLEKIRLSSAIATINVNSQLNVWEFNYKERGGPRT